MMDVDEDEDAGLREIERLTTPRKRYGNQGGDNILGDTDSSGRSGVGSSSHTDLFYVLKWIAIVGLFFYIATRNQVFFCVATICGDFYIEEYFLFRKQEAFKSQLLITFLAVAVVLSRFVLFWGLPVQALLFLWFAFVCRRELLRLQRAEDVKSWSAVFFGLWAFCFISQLDIWGTSVYVSYFLGFLVWWFCVSFAVVA